MTARRAVTLAGRKVDVYPTGVLSDLLALGRVLNPWWLRRNPWPAWLPRHPDADPARRWKLPRDRGWRRDALRYRLHLLRHSVRDRANWRGFYAEGPPGIGRVGTGWTHRRALRDLARAVEERR